MKVRILRINPALIPLIPNNAFTLDASDHRRRHRCPARYYHRAHRQGSPQVVAQVGVVGEFIMYADCRVTRIGTTRRYNSILVCYYLCVQFYFALVFPWHLHRLIPPPMILLCSDLYYLPRAVPLREGVSAVCLSVQVVGCPCQLSF